MDSWSTAAALFAGATLVAVVWQVLRFEATQPPLGWAIGLEASGIVTNGRSEGQVSFRPIGPATIHEVETHAWGAARIAVDTECSRMDCTSEPLVAPVQWVDGEVAFAGFSWLQPSLIRQTPVRLTLRIRLQDGQLFAWRWYRIPRRKKSPQGKWVRRKDRQRRRTFVPEMWGLPGGR